MTGAAVRVTYHMPSLRTVYAQRTIYEGFRQAFTDLGHSFSTFTAGDDIARFLDQHDPQLFISHSHVYYRRQLDLEVMRRYRARGCFVLTKVDFWTTLGQRLRRNDALPLGRDPKVVRLIREGLLGDAFFHVVEPGDPRMDGFSEATGVDLHSVPLAADARLAQARPDDRFRAPMSYVGTWLPAKASILTERVLPLRTRGLRLYGQDWTRLARLAGKAARVGQFFDVPGLRSLQRAALSVADEGTIYASSDINLNVHEDHQRSCGGDCNERSFKIPATGSFQLVDDVACLRRYFDDGTEIVIARDRADWFDKLDHFLARPEERAAIAAAGQRRVLSEHTYHHRANHMLTIAGLR
jgi:spore maturation protein CgeB